MAPVPSSPKRRRVEAEEEPSLDQGDDDYVPYIPVARRRQQKLAQLANRGQAQSAAILRAQREQEEREQREDEEREEEKRRERLRKERTLLEEAQEVMKRKAEEGTHDSAVTIWWTVILKRLSTLYR
jgi:ATP-dependent RNA helicase DDX41